MAVNEIIGTDGNDKLIGTDENDKIYAGKGNDTIYGGKGNDTITAGESKDWNGNLIKFVKGEGNDTIILSKGEITRIYLYENDYNPATDTGTFVDSSTIKYQISTNKKDLIIYFDENKEQGSITLKDFVNNNPTTSLQMRVNAHSSDPSDSRWINLNGSFFYVKAEKNYTGNNLGEIIDGGEFQLYDKNSNPIDDSSKKGLTLDGKGGDDNIIGSKYSDIINGGDGDDNIFAGKGNDTITGGEGRNSIFFVKGDGGNKVVNLTKGEKLGIGLFEEFDLVTFDYTYADISKVGYEYGANGKDLIIYIDKTDKTQGSITLKNYASKDVTAGIEIVGKDSERDYVSVKLNEQIIETNILNKNFTGTWMKDNIDASDSTKNLTIKGGDGNDEISGGKGNDKIYGDNGGDLIFAGEGNDTIYGGNGGNALLGEAGNDVIYGGADSDYIIGGKGNDTVTGGTGINSIFFVKGDGNDVVNLTKGEQLNIGLFDSYNFKSGDYVFSDISKVGYEYGANGKDLIIYIDKTDKTQGSITLKNYASKDVTNGIKIYGKDFDGNETSVKLNEQIIETNILNKNFNGTWMQDSIVASDSTKGLTIDGKGGIDIIKGSNYSDTIKGSGYLYGGKGNDKIYGGELGAKIYGGDGNDTIYGTTGEQSLIFGGEGNDVIYDKSSGSSLVYGGKGDDTITGGTGNHGFYFVKGDGDDVVNLTKGEELVICMMETVDEETARGTSADKDKVGYKYSANGKDLIIYYDKNDPSQGTITLKDYALKDVTDFVGLLFEDSDGNRTYVDLSNVPIETNNLNKNFTGTWMNDKIDASATTLYKDKKQTVEKETKDKGLTLDGGSGDDKITGTKYSDILKASSGKDTIYAGEGNDTLYGGSDENRLFGEAGNDVIQGSANSLNIIDGGAGNDTITGGKGYTKLAYVKNQGDDVINLTKGEKLIINLFESYNLEEHVFNYVNKDNVKYECSPNGKDLIIRIVEDGESKGSITLKNYASKKITDVVKLYLGKDETNNDIYVDLSEDITVFAKPEKNFTGTWLKDDIDASEYTLRDKNGLPIDNPSQKGLTLNGGAGKDSITGTNYSDVINGGDGDDEIHGGKGNDKIYGGNGENGLFGEDGNDVIYGGADFDYINGGKGNDTINGGKGENFIVFAKGDENDVVNLTKGEKLEIGLFEKYDYVNNEYILADISKIGYEYSSNKKDLILYIDKTDKTQGSITLKNFASKDVTDEIKIIGKNSDGSEVRVDLKKDIIVTKETDKNFTGTWLNDNIDASDAILYKKVGKTTVEKETKDKGLTLDGGNGNDEITGTKYSDVINGGNGNDVITGGKGNDTITGGVGENTLYYTKGDGCDVINLTKGENFKLVLSDVTNFDDVLVERSKNGKDVLIYADKENRNEYIILKNYAVKDITNNATQKVEDTSSFILQIGEDEYDFRTQFGFSAKPTKNFTGTWMSDNIDASEYQLYDKKHNEINDSSKKGLTLDGGAGNDVIKGTKYSDVLKGGDGYDVINGGKGNDTIYGGNDINELYGDDGNDVIYGGADNDTIEGGAGNDTITGGKGENTVIYKNGHGCDTINLTKGEDLRIALRDVTNFNDITFKIAPNGKDLQIFANKDNRDEFMTIKDYVIKDVLNSGKFLLGDVGQYEHDFSEIKITVDTTKNFTGTRLDEIINASEATKGVTINSGAGNDIVTGSDYNDVIKGTSGDKHFSGGKGNDTIYGTNGYNELYGGEDDDKIYAGNLQDFIYGDVGNDFIKGGDGDDEIWGDSSSASENDGNDTIYGEGGNDKIFGGGGDDYIDGGAGDDIIYSDGGNDTIVGGTGANKIIYKTGYGNDTIILTKGEDLTIDLWAPENKSDVKLAYAENGKDLLIYPLKDQDEYITIKDFIVKDVTNSITLDINGNRYDLKTGKNITNPTEKPIFVTTNAKSNVTGTWMADELDAQTYTKYNETGTTNLSPALEGLTLDGGAGDDTIIGSRYCDTIKGGDGNDTIDATMGGNDTIYGGKGDDSITCGSGKDLIYGEDGNDTLSGYNDDDTIYGGEGNDSLYGGMGADSLYGDSGDDYIDAGQGDDLVYGGDGNDNLIGRFGNDTIYGEDGDDKIWGDEGNDTIYGGAGNDSIYGGADDDYIEGGKGNDTITGGTGANHIVYNSGDGDDIITLTQGEQFKLELKDVESIDDVEFAVASNRRDYKIYVDKNDPSAGSITLKDFADRDVTNNTTETTEDTSYVKLVIGENEYDLRTKDVTVTENYTGNWFNENIDASSATKGLDINSKSGNDTINGSAYADTINGERGNDSIEGNEGNDRIFGDDGNDTIYGGDGDDRIYGDGGNDTIYGGAGSDYLEGGAGDDYIEGGEGNDAIYGGTGQNHIVYNSGDGNDIITLTQGEQFKLELKDVESIDNVAFDVAGNGKDFIIYVDKNNHSAGSITLQDFAQSDVTNNATETTEDTSYVKLVIGENEYDLRTYPSINRTVTEDYTGTRFAENIDASSATNGLNINANGGNDTIKGSNFADTLNGGDGNDSIEGNEGNDTIYGGAGNDTIKGNAGNNYIYGDDGNDTIYGGTGNDSIEGGAGDDKLYGGSGSCTIHGNTGNDTIWGSSTNGTIYGDEGNDELHGGQGDDIVYGGIGNDYINGEQGNDTLYGGAGNDTLNGGYNSDTLYGGEGDDTYIVYFEKNAINSVIEDESGTNDVVNFTEWPTGLETCTKDQLHLVFNVSKDFDKSTDTISWVNILDDTNFAAWKSNPTGDIDGVKIKDNAIETINSSDNYHVTSADIATLAESVAAWLTEKGYNDVNAALASENTADIEALIAKFGECNWQTTAGV